MDHVQPHNSAHAHTDPATPAEDASPTHAPSQCTLRLAAVSLERSGAGCLCCRTATVGSTISLTLNIARARAERPCRVKRTSLPSPRRALSEQRSELLVRPPRVSATTVPKSLIRAQYGGKTVFSSEVFLPLIAKRVFETGKQTHSFATSWGGIPTFAVLILRSWSVATGFTYHLGPYNASARSFVSVGASRLSCALDPHQVVCGGGVCVRGGGCALFCGLVFADCVARLPRVQEWNQ
jgi:hypothetical protein